MYIQSEIQYCGGNFKLPFAEIYTRVSARAFREDLNLLKQFVRGSVTLYFM